MSCLHVRMYSMHVPGAMGVQKSMPDFLEMELGVIVSHREGAGNGTQPIC